MAVHLRHAAVFRKVLVRWSMVKRADSRLDLPSKMISDEIITKFKHLHQLHIDAARRQRGYHDQN